MVAFVVALVVSATLGRKAGMLGVVGCWLLCPYAGMGKLHMCVAVVGRAHCAQWCLLQALACGWGVGVEAHPTTWSNANVPYHPPSRGGCQDHGNNENIFA